MSAKLRMIRLLAVLGAVLTAGVLLGPSAAESQPSPNVARVVGRPHTVEFLVLLLARRLGAEEQVGVRLNLTDGDLTNLAGEFANRAVAVVGTSADLLQAKSVDVVDAFNFYERAPVALVAHASSADLAGFVMEAPQDQSLAAHLARSRASRFGNPRSIASSGWFGAIANYSVRQVDAVLGSAPLPQYLALQGGQLVWDGAQEGPIGGGSLIVERGIDAGLRDRLVAFTRRGAELLAAMPAEDVVDVLAPDYPRWEPDAVLAAVQVAKAALNPEGRLKLSTLRGTADVLGIPLDAEVAGRYGAVEG